MFSKWQVLQFYVFSPIVTLNFRSGILGTERLRNLPRIPWLVCDGGNLMLETLLLTAVCVWLKPVSYFYHHLMSRFWYFWCISPIIYFKPFIWLLSQPGFYQLPVPDQPDETSETGLGTWGWCHLIIRSSFWVVSQNRNWWRHGSHVRCRPEGLSCHFRKH